MSANSTYESLYNQNQFANKINAQTTTKSFHAHIRNKKQSKMTTEKFRVGDNMICRQLVSRSI